MSMGGLGAISRIVGWMYGSSVTFAVGKSSSAPGQVPIGELRKIIQLTKKITDPEKYHSHQIVSI
jgi:3-dehydroquinate dehydratase-1